MKAGVLAEPILVGREQELAELERCLDSAIRGKGSTVFISGEAGAGKTKLAFEFLKSVKQRGVSVLSGWCLGDAAVPYFPFVQAFDSYFSASDEEIMAGSPQLGSNSLAAISAPVGIDGFGITAWLSGLKPAEKFGQPETLSPQIWKDQVFMAVGKTLHLLSGQSPVILFIEDVHWADSASLALLHYVTRTISSEKILVLATFRSEELTADADGHPHPLAETMRLMRREDILTEIKLQTLDHVSISKIVENMVGGSVQQQLVETLAKESRGNALFLVESLRMLSEHKSLVKENDEWRLGVSELGIPSKVKDIILRRVAILKNDQRRILDAASVIGEKFNVEILSAVLGMDILEVLESLSVIARSTSLICVEGNFYRFDHAKSREALYDEIPIPLRSGYHIRVAERIESSKGGRLPLSDLAYHYSQAGNSEKAAKYALAAGQDELARFSNAEAANHFKFVLNNSSETPENHYDRLKALEGLGDALYAMSLLEEAAKVFNDLIKNAESAAVRLRASKKAMLSVYWLGNIPGAIEIGRKAEAYAHSDRLEHARLRLQRGFITGRSGRNDEAIEDMEKALQVFKEEYSLEDVAQGLVELTFIYRSKGRTADALSAGLRSVLLFGELNDLRGQGLAFNRVAGPLNEFGFNQEALENLAKAIKTEEKVGDYNLLALNHWAVGQTLAGHQKLGEAVTANLVGVEYAEKTNGYFVQGLCFATLIGEYSQLGEIEQAESYTLKLNNLLDKVPSLRSNPNLMGMKLLSDGWLQLARGKFKEAEEIFQNVSRSNTNWSPKVEANFKAHFGAYLVSQKRNEESKIILEEARKIRETISEELAHATPQIDLVAPREIGVGEELNIRLDIVNITKKRYVLMKVESLIPSDFKINKLPSEGNLQNGSIEMNKEELGPFIVKSLELNFQANKAGVFTLNPRVVYIDDVGVTKTCMSLPVTVTVRRTLHAKIGGENLSVPVLADRVTSGFVDLDVLLFGGIPERYAVVLTAPSTDERQLLVKKFLEAGANAGETVFNITAEAANAKELAQKYPSNFYLFLCNPQPQTTIQNLSNVFKVKDIENLTDIDIALAKAFRTLNSSENGSRRICIEVVSDVLLQHHVVNTRRWLSALLPTLKSKGFTILAVVDPQMHSPEELQAAIGVFDGEIRVTEKDTPEGNKQKLKIRRLVNQKYLDKEITLNREGFSYS